MRSIVSAALCLAVALAASDAHSQQYPAKQVRVIVPFAAGGTPDVVARVIAQQLSTQTGQTFVVENRPGADGVVGSQAVAESPPDGYTILVTSSSFVVNPSFHKTMPFNVIRDFEPVTNIAATEAYILGVNPKVPAQTVQEFIALARRRQQISFGRRRRQRAAPRGGTVQVADQDQHGARAIPRRRAGADRARCRRRADDVHDAAVVDA